MKKNILSLLTMALALLPLVAEIRLRHPPNQLIWVFLLPKVPGNYATLNRKWKSVESTAAGGLQTGHKSTGKGASLVVENWEWRVENCPMPIRRSRVIWVLGNFHGSFLCVSKLDFFIRKVFSGQPKFMSFIQKNDIKSISHYMAYNKCRTCYVYSGPFCIFRKWMEGDQKVFVFWVGNHHKL